MNLHDIPESLQKLCLRISEYNGLDRSFVRLTNRLNGLDRPGREELLAIIADVFERPHDAFGISEPELREWVNQSMELTVEKVFMFAVNLMNIVRERAVKG